MRPCLLQRTTVASGTVSERTESSARGPETYSGCPSVFNIPGTDKDTSAVVEAASGRLHSGQTFGIRMPAEDAENMKVVLDFQWGCIVMAVMSGVAGWPAFLVEDEENDDAGDIWVVAVARWLMNG